ncbi:hypothetical protein OESDEN_00541 [Oesophagostomum dentatum]|uniref:Uncharacterized protein n=1 Tax=Oesophagostomum dentatum TaxID=61180 RepID=A0A0B1TUC7_OESDE|nr:hypothetical protein OESDEN_00541 [Oesophagostomum dentatum]
MNQRFPHIYATLLFAYHGIYSCHQRPVLESTSLLKKCRNRVITIAHSTRIIITIMKAMQYAIQLLILTIPMRALMAMNMTHIMTLTIHLLMPMSMERTATTMRSTKTIITSINAGVHGCSDIPSERMELSQSFSHL